MSTQTIFTETEALAAHPETKVLDIRYWDDPILSTVCEPVRDSEFGASLELFGEHMLNTMTAKNGAGLAAPQVGVPIRLFVMRNLVVCNPVIEMSGESVYAKEGCLSLPDLFYQVCRSHTVQMRYFTPLGAEKEAEFNLLDARIVAHETDHLNGLTFLSRLPRQLRRAAERDWAKLKKRYVQ